MQLRSTTPVSGYINVLRWLAITIVPACIIFVGVVQTSDAIGNDETQARIDELSKEIDKTVASTRELNKRSSSIESQLSALGKERTYLESKMTNNTSSQQDVEKQIARAKKDLTAQKSVLGTAMVDIYLGDKISPLEMLASSGSVADFVDNQTLRQSLQSQLVISLKKVRKAELSLKEKQSDLQRIAGDQANQQLALKEQDRQQQTFLVATEGQAGQLKNISKKMATERKQLQSEQQKSIVTQMGGAIQVPDGSISEPVSAPVAVVAPRPSKPEPNKGDTKADVPASGSQTPTPPSVPKPTPKPPAPVVLPRGGYPSYLNNCFVDANALSYGIDPWGYGCRQCVSYTAWKVLQKTGKAAMYWGNAKDWPSSAQRVGYRTDSTPRAKSVAVMTSGPYGHVAWVEKVNSDGTLNISQYNYWLPNKPNGGWGYYSEFRNVSPRTYNTYIYI